VRITIKKIAAELGLSHSTVSRVLNDKQSDLVSPRTRERILQAAQRMGYRPNRHAQALKGDTTQLLGVFLPDGKDYFFRQVLTHLRALTEQSGYELLSFPSSLEQVSENWLRLLHWDLDGVFVFDYLFYSEGLWEALVVHNGYIPPMVGLCSHHSRLKDHVTLDFRPAMEALLRHFAAQGCRRVGYMGRAENFHPEEQRFAVYAQFLEAQGLEPIHFPLPETDDLSRSAREELIAYLRAGRPLPDALFCQNDEMALGAYRALHEAGVAVPENVLLSGCDDIPYIRYLETPLTSLSLPAEAICQQGWRLLLNRMQNPDSPPAQVTLEASLVVRDSTRRYPGGSPSIPGGESPL